MLISVKKHILKFKFAAGTSRGVLNEHCVYYLKLAFNENPSIVGIGECAPLIGLSIDYLPNFENILNNICRQISILKNIEIEDIHNIVSVDFPSVRFGLETALLDLQNNGKRIIFNTAFSVNNKPIIINGLIWMGDKATMVKRIAEKVQEGFNTLKLKIGAIDFDEECEILDAIREKYANDLVIRLDANGAFNPDEALTKLNRLSKYNIHSIEQPIMAGQIDEMKALCATSPIPIALDEELIGVCDENKQALIEKIKPQFIILKPTLLGGFFACNKWIEIAEKYKIDWWLTSALESNIGLNAVSQYAATFSNNLPQGLGTGQLYENNIGSPLEIKDGKLFYNQNLAWNLAFTD